MHDLSDGGAVGLAGAGDVAVGDHLFEFAAF